MIAYRNQRWRPGEPCACRNVQHSVDDDAAQALRAEGLDPDDPAVVRPARWVAMRQAMTVPTIGSARHEKRAWRADNCSDVD